MLSARHAMEKDIPYYTRKVVILYGTIPIISKVETYIVYTHAHHTSIP